MDILREILKLGVFAPSIVWFIVVASKPGNNLATNICVLFGFGTFLASAIIYLYVLKPSFLQSPSNNDQGSGRS